MSKTTCATVNKILKAKGIPFEMVRGNGYYWYNSTSGNMDVLELPSLYVNSISDCDAMCIASEVERDYNDIMDGKLYYYYGWVRMI